MSILDILIAGVVAILAIMGFRKGLVSQLITVVAIVVAIWACVRLSGSMAAFLTSHFAFAQRNTWAWAFVITFILGLIGTFYLGRTLESMLRATHLNLINRLLGAVLGGLKGALLLSAVLSALHYGGAITSTTEERSLLVGPVRKFAPLLLPSLRSFTTKAITHLENLPAREESHQNVDEYEK